MHVSRGTPSQFLNDQWSRVAVGEQGFFRSSGAELEDRLGTSCTIAAVDREDTQVKKSLSITFPFVA